MTKREMVQTIAEELGLRTGEGTSGGLSRFSRSENGTVPLRSATVVFSPVLRIDRETTLASEERRKLSSCEVVNLSVGA